MLEFLKGHKGPVIINEVEYSDITTAMSALKGFTGSLVITLDPALRGADKGSDKVAITEVNPDPIYKIKVRQYMIKAPTPEFDFHTKWNNGIAMPLRIMIGRKIKETPGMIKMELWGDITEEITTHCMKCGKELTNPVSRYFGIGPECGAHGYSHPFATDQELRDAVGKVRIQLRETKWTGWIIKSAIEEESIIK